jgi:flagellar FliL protein
MSADDQTPPAEAPPSKLKSTLPFVLALVLGLVAGAASGMFVVGPALAKGIGPELATRAHAKTASGAADSGDASASESGAKDGKGEPAKQVYTLDNLVLNPAESGGTRFLLLSVTFETTNAALVEEMKARDAELRDAVLVTLGAKTVDQLADMRSREVLKAELNAATKKLFNKKNVVLRVYFPQFVIQ